MSGRTALSAAWLISSCMVAGAGLAWRPIASTPVPETGLGVAATILPPADYQTLQVSWETLREYNPFRLDRKPGDQPIPGLPTDDPTADPFSEVGGSNGFTPAVAGIVGGPPWTVLLEGIPGAERGILLSVGETCMGLVVEEISGDTVVLSGPDAKWTVTLKRPWM